MTSQLIRGPVYVFLFALLAIAYLIGLFVPLMDNDSAHHANIALHMYLTGDYVSLVDNGVDYLDKPHLHFWLSAFSYHLFGVTGFAYKFPSFLFTILGIYSTYRLGRSLYDKETGRVAALIVASAFAFVLANNDVRMDAILTASIAFATWQLADFIIYKRTSNILGAALGLALGFCTKGHIGVFTPAVAALFFMLYRREWRLFISAKWLLLLLLFAVFISPVVYSYYLQYNLHPENVVRGKAQIDGVKFILLNQSIERFSGESFGSDAGDDRFFFLHSFLWAFAPWSLLAYAALFLRIRNFFSRREEWMTTGVLITIMLVVSLSGFKLPHYLNIIFPAASVMTASLVLKYRPSEKWQKGIFTVQLICISMVLFLLAVANAWAFPVQKLLIIATVVLLLAAVFWLLRTPGFDRIQRAVGASAATMALAFFLLNANFYPQLLTYQAGNELAKASRGRVDPGEVYMWNKLYSHSFVFHTRSLRKEFSDSVVQRGQKAWLLYDIRSANEIRAAGYDLEPVFTNPDYNITTLGPRFINPSTRDSACTQLVLGTISKASR